MLDRFYISCLIIFRIRPTERTCNFEINSLAYKDARNDEQDRIKGLSDKPDRNNAR